MDAFSKAKKYAKEFDNLSNNKCNSILFIGQVGSGKTHLSMAIANELMNKGISVIYMPFRDTITTIKQNIMDANYYRKTVDKYKLAKVLLMDDFFKVGVSKSDINIMFEIINHRYFNKLLMIISTEKTFDGLIQIDEALGSRIIESSNDYLVGMIGNKLNYRIYG